MIYLYVTYVVCLLINLAIVGSLLYRDRHTDIDLSSLLAVLFIVALSHVPIVNSIMLLVWVSVWYKESGMGSRIVIKGKPR